jgi:pimeloyl-ACP methyl ester carboxylesterase
VVDPLLGSSTVRGLLLATGSEAPEAVPADLARAIVDSLQRCRSYEQVLAAIGHHRFERAADVDPELPVTVVWGDHDRILTPVHQSRELAPPQTRWVVLPHCGHAPMWDAPEAVVRLVEQTAAHAGTI